MPSIDISNYKKKTAGEAPNVGAKHRDLFGLFQKDITFGNKELPDKKKEELYVELGALLEAGMNLKAALELIATDQEKEKNRELFTGILEKVIKGTSFSAVLKLTGKFSLYEVYSLQIGEESGQMLEVLSGLASFFKNKVKQRRTIVSSLTYPLVVMSTSLGAVFFMLKFVVPMFADVFKRFGGELPWITQKIILISDALSANFYIFLILCIGVAGALFFSKNTVKFKAVSSALVLKTPVIGNIVQKIYLARFCNAMRLLVDARLPLLRAIALSKQMMGYYPITISLQKVEEDILRGKSLHESLAQFSIYPPKMVQLIKVGEETSQLGRFFERIANQYIDDVEHRTATLSSVLQPIIIIFLGIIVGVILVSMYLPLMQMSNSFQ